MGGIASSAVSSAGGNVAHGRLGRRRKSPHWGIFRPVAGVARRPFNAALRHGAIPRSCFVPTAGAFIRVFVLRRIGRCEFWVGKSRLCAESLCCRLCVAGVFRNDVAHGAFSGLRWRLYNMTAIAK